ncbi:hypothetical protein MIN45_P0946 [Methylomarinovum tepidoasis]|uniref:Cysteine rich repeat protein n=1 Tax=Methylomarinovum tepidoasis TaxID=2840183 RepID=A0AAU9C9J5_9GAMM|nr:cysteine rich repeat-containing protein [Methylomarinovum sp. IN45]BCX88577.1 hypothetical protein MIN45_P0946 [Methylomarinovum sp. IN45]
MKAKPVLAALLALALGGCASGGGGFGNERLDAAASQPGPAGTFLRGCETEVKEFCPQVTPGEGRLVACILAHEDKISPTCELALYQAADQLERIVAALGYIAHQCEDDLVKFCSHVEPGEGRLLNCLERHDAEISQRCQRALSDVSMKR